MLKIKGSVDLTELSKFEFVKGDDEWYFDFKEYYPNVDYSYLVVSPKKEIETDFVEREHIDLMLDKIYDLIQAGLVEKCKIV